MPLNRSTRDSIAKHGRYGNAVKGAITPGNRQRAQQTVVERFGIRYEDADQADKALVDVQYDSFNRQLVFTRAPVSGGSSSSGLLLGSILGGNVLPVTVNESDASKNLYPDQRPFSFSMPLTKSVTQNGRKADVLMTLPDVDDWLKYDLPSDFEFGDVLPRLPDGLCYVKLERPSTLGGAAWDANLDFAAELSTKGIPVVNKAYYDPRGSKSIIYLRWNVTSPRVETSKVYYAIGSSGIETYGTMQITSVSHDYKTMVTTLRVSRDIQDDEVVHVAVASNVCRSYDKPPLFNELQEITVAPLSDSGTILVCVNRNGQQTFTAGDLVMLSPVTDIIADEDGVTRVVGDVLGPVGTLLNMPHSHTYVGAGNAGGGPITL